MAIITKTYYVSDVSKTEIDEKDLARAEITWKGKTYNLATNQDEMERVAEYINDLVDGAEEVGGRRLAGPTRRPGTGSGLPQSEVPKARMWLRENGYGDQVAEQGRIKKEFIDIWVEKGKPEL